MTTLNTKQIAYIYKTITDVKAEYGQPGTIANAILSALLTTGEKGIHIKSLEGIHIGASNARSDKHLEQVITYIRWINSTLHKEIGDRAPKLCMDMVGNQRVRWALAKKTDDTSTSDNNDNQ